MSVFEGHRPIASHIEWDSYILHQLTRRRLTKRVARSLCNGNVPVIFCYGRILVVIRRQASVMAAHSGPSTAQSQAQSKKIQTNIIKAMLLVSVLFAVTS